MESWAIDLHKEYFKFSCAHFLIFPDGTKERLHGHNYHVQVKISGRLSDRGLVMDFNHAKPIVRELCDYLDEHWLVPGGHPELKITPREDGHTEVAYRDDHYLVPSEELIVLPIPAKSVIYPEQVLDPTVCKAAEPRLDATHQAFYAELRRSGVDVLDLVSVITNWGPCS